MSSTTSNQSSSEDTTDSTPPKPPAGYAEPYRFTYPTVSLFLGSILLTAMSILIFGTLLTWFQGSPAELFGSTTSETGQATMQFNLSELFLPFLLSILVVAVVHELIHGLAYQRYGYEVSYGIYWSMGAVYAAVFGEFHGREENLVVGAAPLFLITIIFVPLLAVPIPAVAITAFFILTLNTGGSVGDIYALWRFYRMPEGTIFFDHSLQDSFVYEPL